jgi:hypothetical protein
MIKFKIDGKIFDTYNDAVQYAIMHGLCTCSIVQVTIN